MEHQTLEIQRTSPTPYYLTFCLLSGYASVIQEHEGMTKMASENPFVDPVVDPINTPLATDRGSSIAIEDTLVVGRNASLTLGTDSLILLGKCRFHLKQMRANPLLQMSLSRNPIDRIVADFGFLVCDRYIRDEAVCILC